MSVLRSKGSGYDTDTDDNIPETVSSDSSGLSIDVAFKGDLSSSLSSDDEIVRAKRKAGKRKARQKAGRCEEKKKRCPCLRCSGGDHGDIGTWHRPQAIREHVKMYGLYVSPQPDPDIVLPLKPPEPRAIPMEVDVDKGMAEPEQRPVSAQSNGSPPELAKQSSPEPPGTLLFSASCFFCVRFLRGSVLHGCGHVCI